MESEFPKRKNPRIKDFDYSSNGCYFITICTDNGRKLLSDIVGGDDLGAPKKIILKPFGETTEKYINSIETAYDDVNVLNYIIMPDHIHLLIMINNCGTPRSSSPTLPDIVSALKKYINKECKQKIWQRNYYDHIIRNQQEYEKTCNYIEYNALKEY